ncbi:MAG: hypothetical protein CMJ75_01030 [Planctomycetaceae bacterium]|nr:hypothetical protein [Planctomycetaceae bacterium]
MFVFYTLTMTLALLPLCLWFVVRFCLTHHPRVFALAKYCVALGLVFVGLIHLPGYAQQPSQVGAETGVSPPPANESGRIVIAHPENTADASVVVADLAGPEHIDEPMEGLRSDLAERIQIVNEETRPKWVATPRRVLGGPIHLITVSSGMERVPDDCSRSLDDKLSQEVRDYIAKYLIKDPRAARVPDLEWGVKYIRQKLVRKPVYEEQITGMQYGPLYERHALLELDAEFRQQARLQWSQYVKKRRVYGTGLASSGLLGLLMLVFGYLKLDQVTRREHSTSLQLLAAGAILALTASLWLLKGWLP